MKQQWYANSQHLQVLQLILTAYVSLECTKLSSAFKKKKHDVVVKFGIIQNLIKNIVATVKCAILFNSCVEVLSLDTSTNAI